MTPGTSAREICFFCISGMKTDGHRFAPQAVKNGAVALVVTRELDIDIPQLIAADDRQAMADIAARFYDYPAKRMKLAGITGTNGKTTTTYMIKSIAERAGVKTGLIGTIQNMIGDKILHTEHTTPESADLHRLLNDMANEGCGLVVMEVSSHALQMKRVAGLTFDVAVFTNLTQDHLDFHETFERYKDAKKILFHMCKQAAVNADDAASTDIINGVTYPYLTYAVHTQADITAADIKNTPDGVSFEMRQKGRRLHLAVGIPGIFSVYNALAAAAASLQLGIGERHIGAGLKRLPPVAGRFEVLDTRGRDFTIILDYAHTPDSLKNTLTTAKGFTRGRVVSVFGCGGDRDRGKRPLMGEISGRIADLSVITTDNPRTEDPEAILDEIEDGIRRTKGRYIRICDRKKAMRYAIAHAQKDDIIILAGKGHETYQEINGVKYPFAEKEIVSQILDSI